MKKIDRVYNFARINIDYSKKKPKTKFSYALEKRKANRNLGLFNIMLYTFTISVLISYIFLAASLFLIAFSIIIILGVILPTIIFFIFKDKVDDLSAKMSILFKQKKYYVIKNEDIYLNSKNQWEARIPNFENLYMQWEAFKDFSKYLNQIVIHEHEFKYFKIKIKTDKNGKKRKIKNGEGHEDLWYASFIFSQKPINGKIEVIFI